MDIITSHTNLDFDGLASMIAAHKIYPNGNMYFSGSLNKNVKEFMALHRDSFIIKNPSGLNLSKINKLIIVDTQSPERLGKFEKCVLNNDIKLIIFDHHTSLYNNSNKLPFKTYLKITEPLGATTTIFVEKIRKKGISITPLEATVFALGIYEDTGSLTFESTTSRDVKAVAYLLEKGANLNFISNFLSKPLKENQRRLFEKLIMEREYLNLNGVKIMISRTELKEYIGGLSLIANRLKEIDDAQIIILIVRMGDKIYITARSEGDLIDLNNLLKNYNGGGHIRAASGILRNKNIQQVKQQLLRDIKINLKSLKTAADIMSSPVKAISPETTITEANKILLRYGHTGLPITENGKIVGIISRRDIEKAKHYGLGHAPVKGFMSRNVVTITPDTVLPEIQHLMIANNIGRLPVIEKGKLVGIVTRTDILKQLHRTYSYESENSKTNFSLDSRNQTGKNLKKLIESNFPKEIKEIIMHGSNLADKLGYRIFLVGGIVRDLILNINNYDIDLVIEGDGLEFARELNEILNGEINTYDQFKTASIVTKDGIKIDIATARREFYEFPAALPQVEQSSIKFDLYRRDFTINTLAISLNRDTFGILLDFFGGEKDIIDRKIKILYNLSFIEDPIRIFRAVRFKHRLGFKIDDNTWELARNAVKSDVMHEISFQRIKEELYIIFDEVNTVDILNDLKKLGILKEIFPEISSWDKVFSMIAQCKKGIEWYKSISKTSEKLNNRFLYSIIFCYLSESDEDLYKKFGLSKNQREIIRFIRIKGREIIGKVTQDDIKPFELFSLLKDIPDEGLIFLTILSKKKRQMKNRVKQFITELRSIRIYITGKDLEELGVKPGPLYKEIINKIYREKINGKIKTREEELELLRVMIKEKREDEEIV